jgi:co-chaperonin GroES (HSP10)
MTPTATATPPPAIAWQPKHDQVIVRPLEAAQTVRGGLIVTPEAHRERPQRGIVLAIGPTAGGADTLVPMGPGDMVAFGKWAGIEFEDPLTAMRLLVMREVECILSRPAGTFALLEHDTPRGERVVHEAGEACEWCPTPDLEAERQRHQAAVREELTAEEIEAAERGPVS